MTDFQNQDWLPIHKPTEGKLSQSDLIALQASFGGKMAGLVLLANEGNGALEVPPGIGLRHDVVAWVDSVDAGPSLLDQLTEETLLPALDRLRGCSAGKPKYARLVVRSSGNLEDGTESGFPGVFDTVTGVTPDTYSVVRAVRRVLMSSRTENVQAYCANQGIPFSSIKMACVIQWEVQGALSGVAMTSTNNAVCDQYVLLNFARGQCGTVVDGKSNNEIVFTKDEPVVAVSANCRDFDSLFWNGREPFKEFAERTEAAPFSLQTLAEVVRKCVIVERLERFRRPMDVEWTVDHEGDIYILQARPIVHHQAIALQPGM